MSENETVELSPTENLIGALEVGNFSSAEELFNTLMNDKVQDALNAEKVSVAGQIFNGVEVEDLEVSIVSPHKFNGCGLVISSEVVKAGVTIPRSVFFIHEDTAFMMMTNKVLGNIPQYHFKNILVVHNRKHPDKRTNIKGEENLDKTNPGAQREAHDWYTPANKMCEENCYKLFDC